MGEKSYTTQPLLPTYPSSKLELLLSLTANKVIYVTSFPVLIMSSKPQTGIVLKGIVLLMSCLTELTKINHHSAHDCCLQVDQEIPLLCRETWMPLSGSSLCCYCSHKYLKVKSLPKSIPETKRDNYHGIMFSWSVKSTENEAL